MNTSVSYFDLMKSRGDIVRKAIDQSGQSKALVAKKLGIGRTKLYYKLDQPDLDYDFIIQVYKVIKRDISKDFPDLIKFVVGEPVEEYSNALNNCKEELETYKEKYIKLMEEYTQVLKENQALQARQIG
jgi:uncharacterized protein Usg